MGDQSVAANSLPITITPKLKMPEKKNHVSPAVSFVSGGIAGAVEASMTYPFEFAKTRAQLGHGSTGSRNPFKVLSIAAQQDGIRSIYTGCSSLIIGTTFKAAVRFLAFDSIKNLLANPDGSLSPGNGILAGMMAGAVESVVAVTPTERIKTALIDAKASKSSKTYNGTFQAVSGIIRERGITELYRGLVSTTIKQSATSAVRMGSYNVLKDFSQRAALPKKDSTTFAMGAVAGVITVYATQPFDTIKTRAQSAKGQTTIAAFRDVLATGGVKAFWSGSTMRLGRLVLSGGIVFTVYERVSSLLSYQTPQFL
ncbi:hypothetical protein E8E14_000957 [Neopestalotiopsis sp. 37M]|nr:hypothetical protein E8E14_000957 [Neopestalotiopsis sp. 37M]